jgi:cytochrome oxidase Cu insertion factor (SCO1/SenC/PrrC family)
VVANYADVQRFKKPLGKSAESDLFEIQHLSVGKPVPEIAGEDVDGKEFKLSDYRGKVVLLDFWGNW